MHQDSYFHGKVLIAYLKSQKMVLIIMTVFTALTLLLQLLSHLPLDPVLYAMLLSWIIGILMLVPGFFRFSQDHLTLTLLCRSHSEGQDASFLHKEEMPEPANLIAADYQALLLSLNRLYQALTEEMEQRSSETQRYYTLWAHQIKTPISAMRLLLQEEPPAFHREELKRELFKIEQYVGMALQYLRLEHGTHDLLLQSYELGELVRQALKRTSTLFISKKISIELGEIHRRIITDEKWVVFVLEQLLTNAVKYTPSGKVSIQMLPGDDDTLVIRDTGIGILPEDLPRIFEWGYTGCNGRIDKHSTGIGLFLCRQALNLLGHSITIQSEPEKGTAVYLNFAREHLEIE